MIIPITIAIVLAWVIIKVLTWSPKGTGLVSRKLQQDAALLRGIAGLFRGKK